MSEVLHGPRLARPIDADTDHVRGGGADRVVTIVLYGDYLCPYCRRLRRVLRELREAMGERLAYVFRHFPNERTHPGATFASLASEAAAEQGQFWRMYDGLYDHNPPLSRATVEGIAASVGLDMQRFASDVERADVKARVERDLEEGRRLGIASTPTLYIDGHRYDGAWDFHSLLEAAERPLGVRVGRAARNFANLPASSGLVLLLAAVAALIVANSPLAPAYSRVIGSEFGIVAPNAALTLSLGAWASEGLLTFFFLVIGLEIRREMKSGRLTDWRAAALPVIASIGGVIAPALIYLAINQGPTARGWPIPTPTDVAFSLGILVFLGARVPTAVTVFIATLAVADDILSMLTLAISSPHAFSLPWLIGAAALALVMYALSRSRIYAVWPYVAATFGLWVSLHQGGVHAALAGVVLAALIPTRPAPNAGALLAQAATAFTDLEEAEATKDEDGPRWDSLLHWTRLNLAAASERLLSPAERVQQAVQPWASFVVLPLFALSATGVALAVDLTAPGNARVMTGVVLGLVIGKPLGILAATALATRLKLVPWPEEIPLRIFIGAACLCGVGDTVALLMADQAFPGAPQAQAAKAGVLAGSILAGALGTAIILAPTARRRAGKRRRDWPSPSEKAPV